MRLENVRLEYKNPLVNKYIYEYDAVAGLFNYNPAELGSYQKRAQVVSQKKSVNRSLLVDILKDYNRHLGCGEKTLANIEKLLDEDGMMILTGQQPGVFTGPLYTVYKAMTAIQRAEEMSGRLGKKVVPVFWVGGEDHDFGEINHLDILTPANRIERIRLDQAPGKKVSVGEIPITEDVFALIDKLAANTADSEFKGDIMEKIRGFARDESNLGDWFARMLNWLFDRYGLIILNPLDKRYKEMGREVFTQFVRHIDEINQAFREGRENVQKLGFAPQVDKEDNQTHLFIYIEQERLPLLVKGDKFYTRGRDLEITTEELLQMIDERPGIISGNVVLKPVAQDYMLPILAYVAGPGEIGYYAQYRGIYSVMGLEMPIIYPRVNITLIERNIARYMDKHILNINDVLYNYDEKLNLLLAATDEVGIEETFGQFKKKFVIEYETIINHIAQLDSNLKNLGEENTRRIISQIEHLESKARQQLRKKNEDSVRQLEKIRLHIAPQKNLQERVYNIFPYLFKYGVDIINELMNLHLNEDKDHKLVFI